MRAEEARQLSIRSLDAETSDAREAAITWIPWVINKITVAAKKGDYGVRIQCPFFTYTFRSPSFVRELFAELASSLKERGYEVDNGGEFPTLNISWKETR